MPFAMLFVLLLGSIWGTSTTVSKLALQSFDLLTILFWYILIAFAVLVGITLIRRGRVPLDRSHLVFYVVNGLLGLSIPAYNNMVVLPHVPAGVMSTVIATAPLFTYALALLAGQERFLPTRASGVVLGFCGVLFVLLPAGSLPTPDAAGWLALGMLTPFLYGLTAVLAAHLMPQGTDALSLATGFLAVSTIVFAIGLSVSEAPATLWPPVWPGWYAVVWMGVFSAAAYVLYFQIIRIAGPVYMSQVGYVVVTVGVITGMLVFGERHSLWVWLGITLMLAGVTLVNLGQRRAARQV